MGLNAALVSKTYSIDDAGEVTAELVEKFVDATSAGDIAAYRGDVVPPMLVVRFLLPGLTAPVLDPELGADLLRLVHGEQTITWKEPLRVGDRISVASEIIAIEEKSSGETASVRMIASAGDRVVAEGMSLVFIRKGRPKGEKNKKPTSDDNTPAPVTFSQTLTVDADQSVRYAEASGDHNPIHTDDATAKAAGLPGVILHGLCTMAFAHNALVTHSAGGDPRRVKSLAVRFKRPVLMGDVLTIEGRDTDNAVAVTVHNQAGVPVLTDGRGVIG